MNQKGVVHLFLPILILLVIVAVVFYPYILKYFKNSQATPPMLESIIPWQSPTPTATPTIIPTPAPTPIPTVKPTISATPKPTTVAVSGPPGSGYSSITVATEKGNFGASVLSIDLNSARAITDTANDGDCADNCLTKTLSDFVSANGGFAGVNGTYFCPASYADCSSKKDSFDFPVYNTRLGRWINAGNLSWNGRSMVYFDGGGAHYMQNANGFGGGLTAGIVNHPGLLSGGAVQIDDNQSGLSDKQKSVGTKVGIGVRGDKNVMIVIGRNVNMQQFAYVFKALGASGALNLDTGGSTALYFNGRYLAGPGRNIPNAIIFAR